jgi:hypothetical protein
MTMDVGVKVLGIRELSTAFKAVDSTLSKEMRLSLKAVADHVVGIAQQKMPFQSGTAASSLKPRATAKGAGIAFPDGGTPWRGVKADYYPWLDFGGTTGKGHAASGHNGFGGGVVRPIVKGGRFLYPAIAESKEYISSEVDKAVQTVAKDAGFDTKDGI